MFIFLSVCSLLVPLWLHWDIHGKIIHLRTGISGYRITMSRINGETWKYAHRYWEKLNLVLGIILAIVSLYVLILMRSHANFEMISVHLVFIQLGIMALTIIPTEFLLHKHFTKQGIKK